MTIAGKTERSSTQLLELVRSACISTWKPVRSWWSSGRSETLRWDLVPVLKTSSAIKPIQGAHTVFPSSAHWITACVSPHTTLTTSSFPCNLRKHSFHRKKPKPTENVLLGTISSISSDMAVPSTLDAKQRYFPWKLVMIPRFWITNVPELLDATILVSDNKSNGFPSFVQLKLKNNPSVT